MSRAQTQTYDGLVVGYGRHTVDNDVGAVFQSANGLVTYQLEITMADLNDTYAAADSPPQSAAIPRGSAIQSAYIHSIIAPVSSGGGTLDIGFWSKGLATEVVDVADSLVADVTVAEFGLLGEAIQLDGVVIADADTAASTVATVGATSNSDVVPAPSWETAAFQSGVIRLVINYFPPMGSAGRTITV